jgi:hypothetical protein
MRKLYKSIFLTILLCLLLSSCATPTPYKAQWLTGGYSDIRYDKNTVKVSFRGNGYTSRETVEDYLLYRCAEITVERGYDYFVVLNNHTGSEFNLLVTGSGGLPTHVTKRRTKYGSTALIKMFKGKKPKNLPNAYNASEVIKHIGPSIKNPSTNKKVNYKKQTIAISDLLKMTTQEQIQFLREGQ